MKKNTLTGNLFDIFNIVFFIVLSFIMLFPFLNVLAISLSPEEIASRTGIILLLPREITFKAYKAIWSQSLIKNAFLNSVFVTSVASVLGVIITGMFAYGLAQDDLPGNKFFTIFLLVAMMTGAGMIPKYILVKDLGLLNSLWSLIIPPLIKIKNIIIMKAFFDGLPDSLSDAAKIDGCTEVGIFFRIVLPLSMPIFATITLFYAVSHWNSFMDAVMFITDRNKITLPVILKEILVESVDTEGMRSVELGKNLKMATVVYAIAPILCVYPLLQKHFTKGIMIGAVKG